MMAYNNKFVVSVLVSGKPLRELNVQGKRTCTIPFGSEYKIRIKNRNNIRAMASLSIDGTDVLCGKRIILGPNETVDLERFVDDKDSGSKFKFISLEQGEQTGEIQDRQNDRRVQGVFRGQTPARPHPRQSTRETGVFLKICPVLGRAPPPQGIEAKALELASKRKEAKQNSAEE